MKKISPIWAGLAAAGGLLAYVSLFASTVYFVQSLSLPPLGPFSSIAFFLMVFMTSALICSSIGLGYPIYLFSTGEKPRAYRVFMWTVIWMIALSLCVAAVLISL